MSLLGSVGRFLGSLTDSVSIGDPATPGQKATVNSDGTLSVRQGNLSRTVDAVQALPATLPVVPTLTSVPAASDTSVTFPGGIPVVGYSAINDTPWVIWFNFDTTAAVGSLVKVYPGATIYDDIAFTALHVWVPYATSVNGGAGTILVQGRKLPNAL